MIAIRIGHDHFMVWRIAESTARNLVPGLDPVVTDGSAWLLCAIAQFQSARASNIPLLPRQAHAAGWFVPCRLDDGMIGNACVQMFSDHPALLFALRGTGIQAARLRLNHKVMILNRVTHGHIIGARDLPGLDWFEHDRCGIIRQNGHWLRWPIAKRDWTWTISVGELHSPIADSYAAQPIGVITSAPTVACWGKPHAVGKRLRAAKTTTA